MVFNVRIKDITARGFSQWLKLGLAGVLGLLLGTAAVAQSQLHCVPAATLQRNAAQSYLVRMTMVQQLPVDGRVYAGARQDERGGRFEVLKVYSGNVDALKALEVARLVVNCNQGDGPRCTILEEQNYPFYAGQMMVLYERPDADGVVTIKRGPCPGSQRLMDNDEDLAIFESMYPPVWVSATWQREHGGADAQPVSADAEDAATADDVQAQAQEPEPADEEGDASSSNSAHPANPADAADSADPAADPVRNPTFENPQSEDNLLGL